MNYNINNMHFLDHNLHHIRWNYICKIVTSSKTFPEITSQGIKSSSTYNSHITLIDYQLHNSACSNYHCGSHKALLCRRCYDKPKILRGCSNIYLNFLVTSSITSYVICYLNIEWLPDWV